MARSRINRISTIRSCAPDQEVLIDRVVVVEKVLVTTVVVITNPLTTGVPVERRNVSFIIAISLLALGAIGSILILVVRPALDF